MRGVRDIDARAANRAKGFTLIELLTALFILSILALMSYRGLAAVLDTRDRVTQDAEKWRSVASFFARFERDVNLAMPRAVRSAPAWRGIAGAAPALRLEFSRFSSLDGVDTARRIAYRLNDTHEIELWLWPGLDTVPSAVPVRYPLLGGVAAFEMQYLDDRSIWTQAWPTTGADNSLPRAVHVRVVLESGEEIVRIFELSSNAGAAERAANPGPAERAA